MSYKVTITSAKQRHTLHVGDNGLWESSFFSPAEESRRVLNAMKDGTLGDRKGWDPASDPETRISTLVWGLNTGLVKPEYLREINKALGNDTLSGRRYSPLRRHVPIEAVAITLLWFLHKHPAYLHRYGSHNDLMSSGLTDLRFIERFSEVRNTYVFTSGLDADGYKNIFGAIAEASKDVSRAKWNSTSDDDEREWGNLDKHEGNFDLALALFWYEEACVRGFGDQVLSDFVRVFDGEDCYEDDQLRNLPEYGVPFWDKKQSTQLETEYRDETRTRLDSERTWHLAISRCGLFTERPRGPFHSPTWAGVLTLMCRSFFMAGISGEDPFKPLSLDTYNRFPTPGSILMAADPNKPGFWRLLIGLKRAMMLCRDMYMSMSKYSYDSIRVGNTKAVYDSMSEESLVELLHELSWHAPTDNGLMNQLSEEAERLCMTSEMADIMRSRVDPTIESL